MTMLGSPFLYGEIELISSEWMRIPIIERRSWIERLFSLPWRPLQKTKVTGYKPMEEIIKIGNTLYAAPEIVAKLSKELANP